eukprot:gnl/Dysnectes_brevis/7288_a12089_335.p1 GENE.gnl/Dysnectes_brevis/7288_a12089_335~~gnl/Dysnectes_brevis/7288_a12089_335.p1  ORF type:complete len:388 (+),score=43.33 gnl/Dysnectes_brevis/7288_a12089_335:76-1164(+)
MALVSHLFNAYIEKKAECAGLQAELLCTQELYANQHAFSQMEQSMRRPITSETAPTARTERPLHTNAAYNGLLAEEEAAEEPLSPPPLPTPKSSPTLPPRDPGTHRVGDEVSMHTPNSLTEVEDEEEEETIEPSFALARALQTKPKRAKRVTRRPSTQQQASPSISIGTQKIPDLGRSHGSSDVLPTSARAPCRGCRILQSQLTSLLAVPAPSAPALREKLSAAELEASRSRENVGELRTRLRKAAEIISSLRSERTVLSERIDSLESKVSLLNAKGLARKRELVVRERAVGELAQRLASLGASRAGLLKRLGDSQKLLDDARAMEKTHRKKIAQQDIVCKRLESLIARVTLDRVEKSRDES